MKRLPYLYFAFSILIVFSCQRKDIEQFGPDLAIASAQFQMTTDFTSNKSSVNLAVEALTFATTFNEEVTWNIIISGASSGATKTITGTSNFIDATNASWDGGHDGRNFFHSNEDVTTLLTVFGVDESWSLNITLLGSKVYDGTLLYDFDDNGLVLPDWNWWFFFDENCAQCFDEKVKFVEEDSIDPIQGEYLAIYGQDGIGPNSFYVGGFSHGDVGSFGLTGSLSDNYFNCYLRPQENSCEVTINLYEADGDFYEYKFIPDWESWKKVSFKISDASYTGSGDGTKDITTINKVEFLLNTEGTPGHFVGYDVDYLIFTEDGPFIP